MEKFELNILKDESALKTLSLLSIVITILSILPFYALERLFSSGEAFYHQMTFKYIIFSICIVIIGSAIIIVLHECIHGLFFKIFHPHSRVKYGYKDGMFYATAPGEVYHRNQFSVIAIMPFIVITILLLIVQFYLDETAITVILIFHTGACVGDFYFLYLFYKHWNLCYVEDTETGIIMYEYLPQETDK
jgi:hypothetical protein